MLNRIILIGRLVREPELRYTPNGIAVSRFTLAVDRPFTNDQGEEADFIDIICWRKLAKTVAEHLDKGRLVAVEGRLQIRRYEDKEGKKRRASEVVASQVKFLDYHKKEQNDSDEDWSDLGTEVPVDDDVPF